MQRRTRKRTEARQFRGLRAFQDQQGYRDGTAHVAFELPDVVAGVPGWHTQPMGRLKLLFPGETYRYQFCLT